MLTNADREQVAKHWDAMPYEGHPSEWWHFAAVLRQINLRLAGADSAALSAGVVKLIRDHAPDRTFDRAVSVGCGAAKKEHVLSVAGLVRLWRLYELSPARAKDAAARLGPFAEVLVADGLDDIAVGKYDLVYWDNALHHMPDVAVALAWSRRVMAPDGALVMFDYTGPVRFQYGHKWLRHVNRARATFPAHWFAGRPREWKPASAQHWLDHDPSEACDSAAIMPALAKVFPRAEVRRCGGLCFSCAMCGLWSQVRPDDTEAVAAMLRLDAEHADAGRSIYTGAWAWQTN
jgi:SAM-dependent methyltransferase